MGWKGTVRAMAAASRRAERDAERRRKEFNKQQIANDAADSVTEWLAHMHEVVSLHMDAADDMDWAKVAAQAAPLQPERTSGHEDAATSKLTEFRPRFWHPLVGGSEKRQVRLEEDVANAKQLDTEEHRIASANFEAGFAEWKADKELAERLLSGELAAQRDVIAEMQSLESEGLIGSHISFQISDEHLHAIAHVHGNDVVPKVRLKQLQSGKLSETKMPAADFNELYQDYICSVALRVAGDLFAYLPRAEIYVTCVANMLDKKTGHLVDTPILSVYFVRETFRRLSLARIDPSDSMCNFIHNMQFKRTSGFSGVEPLKPINSQMS